MTAGNATDAMMEELAGVGEAMVATWREDASPEAIEILDAFLRQDKVASGHATSRSRVRPPPWPDPPLASGDAVRAWFRHALDKVYVVSGYIAGFFLVCISVLIIAQVAGRFLVLAIDATELAGYCLAATTYFGLAYTFARAPTSGSICSSATRMHEFAARWRFGAAAPGRCCWATSHTTSS